MWQPALIEYFRARLAEWTAGGSRAALVPDLPCAAEAFLVWGLRQAAGRAVVWIGDGPRTLELFYRDLQALAPPAAPLLWFPPEEAAAEGAKAAPAPAAIAGERLAALAALPAAGAGVFATCIQALLQPVLPPQALAAATLRLERGAACDMETLSRRLAAAAYRFVPEVQSPGEAAVRGGLLDVWPVAEPRPLRCEFFGPVLESLRTFEPLSQRSLEPLAATDLLLAGLAPAGAADLVTAHFPPETLFVWSDLVSIAHHAGLYEETRAAAPAGTARPTLADVRRRLAERPQAIQLFVGSGPDDLAPAGELDLKPLHGVPTFAGRTPVPPDAVEAARRRLMDEVLAKAAAGYTIRFFLDTEGARKRFQEAFGDIRARASAALSVHPLSQGFYSDALRLMVISETDLYGRKIRRRRYVPAAKTGADEAAGARVSDWTEMEPGDLVVHVEHGVGRYLGLREIAISGALQEALAIEYAEGAKLYIPVAQAHLLTRYVGLGKKLAALHPLDGKRWAREKESAERAIRDLAAQLLETQAARETLPGHAFGADTAWQHEFESAFPYEETRDQERAIAMVKRDLEKARPMDRLICGDAGYGKTEVAMRAAFKAVLGGKQVAMLVPTTVLAQQHFQTFTERMAPFPVAIEMLSRFCSRSQIERIRGGLRDGTVDIVIGTHGLLQPGVQFRDLGLVIIDEEQRFGVRHKERFKQMRSLVDVLTLTATPIPRTLYLSLTGARDLSTIQTPPQERLAVETVVAPDDDAVVREAILRELNREGQIYFIHNRVRSIERMRQRLQALTPEARLDVAHGQMPSSQLAEVMQQFAEGACDLLLCTTIVESGMDIPNANTIFIDRADRFGLAELYQLRGRVGRSNQKAYAYMLLPRHAAVDPTARKRIQAIAQYSDLGVGFRLAMRDLEIRGAGNLLGAEQSGHITAVGFGLYCQLLKRSVAGLKGEAAPPVIDVELRLDFMDLSPEHPEAQNSAFIPASYIEDERLRVSLYRKIAEAALPDEVAKLTAELKDRFGPLPPAVQRLLALALLRIEAAARGITLVETREDLLRCVRPGRDALEGGRFPRLKKRLPDARLKEILACIRRL